MLRSLAGRAVRGAVAVTAPGIRRGEHLIRYSMYRKIQEQARGLDFGHNVLSISHSGHLCSLVGIDRSTISDANYPEVSINQTGRADGSCSAVVSDQVFEHMGCTPTEAVAESYRILRPGGIAIHTTCFLTPYHGSPDFDDERNGDYWRYTASGLKRLHRNYGRVIAADGWGNPLMPLLTGLGLGHVPVPEARWHPLNMLARYNRASYAFVVWVIAQK
jgi:hypothetical protein